jgi:DNA-binding GntR family transcriptional regulator
LYNLPKLDLSDYRPLRDVVFDNLRESILTGKLKPGQRLMEIQLAEGLGVSRTPIREAIRKLELEDLVVMLPRKGAYVSNMSLKDITNVLQVRAKLEGLSSSLAAKKRNDIDVENLKKMTEEFKKLSSREDMSYDDIMELSKKDIDFHKAIRKMSDNNALTKAVTSIWEQEYKFRLSYMKCYDTSMSIADEHMGIVKAIIDGDDKLAEELTSKHIMNSEEFILNNADFKDSSL